MLTSLNKNNIHISPVSEKAWSVFLSELKPHTFLQSWDWGDFNKKEGHKVFRLGIYENGRLRGVALTLKISARRGSFLFMPHGPILEDESDLHGLLHLFNFLRELARRKKCSFIRISPITKLAKESEEIFKDLGFKRAPTHMHSELNWILDIRPSETELLKEMRKTTRYSITKAQKDGVIVETSSDPEDVKLFNSIYKATVDRQNFTPFSLAYLEKEFKTFVKNNHALLFFAKYNGEVISTAMIIFEAGGAYYHHGASILKYPKITASYLLQWEIIKEAKRRGCTFYNFWGVAPEGKNRTSFKNIPARVAEELRLDREARRGSHTQSSYGDEDKRSERGVIPATLRDTANFRHNIVTPPHRIGATLYDFGRRSLLHLKFAGIATRDIFKGRPHPWAGLSLFKKGFGGYAEEYIPAMDLKLNRKYWLTYWIEKARKIKRGL